MLFEVNKNLQYVSELLRQFYKIKGNFLVLKIATYKLYRYNWFCSCYL